MANEFKVKNGVITPAISNVANSDVAISVSGTGKIKLNGLSWPNTDGTANYVLKTDGSGNLTWAAQTGGGGGSTASMVSQDFTGTGSQTVFTLGTAPVDINYTMVSIDGVFQNRTSAYTVSGTTLTFTEAPAVGAAIEVTTLVSGSLTGVATGGTVGQVLTKASTTDYDTTWTTISTGSGTVTSVSGTGTVSGLTLTGTVTSSGSLTLGGTLDLSSPPAIGNTAANSGAFTTLSASSTVSGTGFSTYLSSPPAIGNTAANSGAFTTLSASSTVSGTGFSTYLASPPAIGGTTAAAGSFTTLSSSNQYTNTVAIGTAPFVVTSTTRVANLNAATAGTADLAVDVSGGASNQIVYQTGSNLTDFIVAPTVTDTYLKWTGSAFSWATVAASGGTVTSVSGTGTVNGLTLTGTVTSSGSLTLGGTLDLSSPPAIGGTTAAAGSFTTLSASSTVSGTGFSTYLASPPAIGGTTAAAGSFTTLSASNQITSTLATGTAPFVVTSRTPVSNLRITPSATTIASAATITPDGTYDLYIVSALAVNATIATPSGTPINGQKLLIRIEDNGTTRTLNWTTTSGAYRAVGVTLPTTTGAGARVLYIGCIYNNLDTFWDVIAVAQLV